MASDEIRPDGSVKSNEETSVSRATSEVVQTADGFVRLVPQMIENVGKMGQLVPNCPVEEWEQWVLDRIEGLGIRQISKKHKVPIRDLMLYFQTPGIVKFVYDALLSEHYEEVRAQGLKCVKRLMSAEDIKTQRDGARLALDYIKAREEKEMEEARQQSEEEERVALFEEVVGGPV